MDIKKFSGKITKTAVTYVTATFGKRIVSAYIDKYEDKFVLKINRLLNPNKKSNRIYFTFDDVYGQAFVNWFFNEINPEQKNFENIKIATKYFRENRSATVIKSNNENYDILIAGVQVSVSFTEERIDIKKASISSISHDDDLVREGVCIDYAGGKKEFNKILNFLEEKRDHFMSKRGDTQINLWNGYGWHNKTVFCRDIDTIFLPDGVKASFYDDIKTFFESEEKYAKFGLPWHRGCLLWGPPGTGKTSLVRGIPDVVEDVRIYTLTITKNTTESDLFNMLQSIPNYNIVLLEDVDGVPAALSREEENNEESRLTISSLLNAIDGVFAPEGIYYVFSSNYPEKLDKAFSRAGRIDLKILVDYIEPAEVKKAFSVYFDGYDPGDIKVAGEKTFADMMTTFQQAKSGEEALYKLKELNILL